MFEADCRRGGMGGVEVSGWQALVAVLMLGMAVGCTCLRQCYSPAGPARCIGSALLLEGVSCRGG